MDTTIWRSADAAPVLGGDGRTVELRLLSFDQDYVVSDDGVHTYTERWAPTAFRRSIKRTTGKALTYEHRMPGTPPLMPVGGIRRAWEFDGGLLAEGEILRTPAGEDLLTALRSGVLDIGVSIEARVVESRPFLGGFERRQAELRSVAFTLNPQYADAALVAMRSEPAPTPRSATVKARMATVFAELT